MCFSLEASFGASAVLAVIGCMNLPFTRKKTLLPFAIIPFIFAFQQFAEGLVWYGFRHSLEDASFFSIAKLCYISVVRVVWPVWFPLALYFLEKKPRLQFFILFFVIAGLVLSLLNAYYLLTHEIVARVVQHSIQYIGGFTQAYFYIVIVLGPFFISSMRSIKIMGIIVLGSILLAEYLYHMTFLSMWCFFAAVLSITTHIILKNYNKLSKA